MSGPSHIDTISSDRPLRVAALVKQVPVAECLSLGPDGRLRRDEAPLEMNPYCRRAVSKGVEVARSTGGTCMVFTLGPPAAEDTLREAVAWGADHAFHLCDPAFAGSDTLATARALAAALRREGPFDLVLVGRNTVDGDTGQVGPELAELLELPFAAGVRHLALDTTSVRAELELDDGWAAVSLELPAVLSVAERLCEPAKVPPEGRDAVSAEAIDVLTAVDLGTGPFGEAASPTVVGAVRELRHDRARKVLSGSPEHQVNQALELLEGRGALAGREGGGGDPPSRQVEDHDPDHDGARGAPEEARVANTWCVVVEPGRPGAAHELLGAVRRLSDQYGGEVMAFGAPTGEELGAAGADRVVELEGALVAEDVARALVAWCVGGRPTVVLAPSTTFGREVAGRAAAALGAGLIGDAVGVEVAEGILVAPKPAFAGALVADITCRSSVQLVTVRPGVLPAQMPQAGRVAAVDRRAVAPAGRVRVLAERRDDDVEVLARAEVVIGVGTGVDPGEYHLLDPLAAVLGAELAATRKVTDRGWMPRARQVGITGRSIAPRLYVAIGLSGKFNHVVGVRSAASILAINEDAGAPIFEHADIGLVADWHEVLPLLALGLEERAVVASRQ